jgi:hypothetical protein
MEWYCNVEVKHRRNNDRKLAGRAEDARVAPSSPLTGETAREKVAKA